MSHHDTGEPGLPLDRIDHLVLTVADVEASIAFYTRTLGMRAVTFGDGRRALTFGDAKINLHPASDPIRPHAHRPTSGSGDLCLVADTTIDRIEAHLQAIGTPIEEGPVARTGALGPILSCYVRDPDGNLVEISTYRQAPEHPLTPDH